MKHGVVRVPLASAILVGTVLGVQAQELDDGDVIPLEEITVTGTGLPTEVMNSPSSVTVVTEEEIKRVPPTSVARILADVPGVRVSESGIERIRIRGESSQRVAILIDGQRLSDHTTYGTPILISPTEIERIEVVRGPSSVVSGNRAIGGVINIITKRGADAPVEVSATAGYVGANKGYRGALSVAGTVENFDYRLSYSKSDLDDRESPDGPLVPSGSEDRDIHAFLGYRAGNHYFGVRAQDYDLSADVYTGDPDFVIDLPKRDLRKYGAFYEGADLTPWMSMLKLDAYTQKVDREFYNDLSIAAGPATIGVVSTSVDDQKTSGVRAVANMEFAPGHRTVVGFEYEDDRLTSDKETTTTVSSPFGPPSTTADEYYSDASIRTASVFAQHEIQFNKLTAMVGARYYDVTSELDSFITNGVASPGVTNSDDRALGSFGLVYALREDTVLRANIGQGYTYPSLSELFLTSTGGGGTIVGNPNLRPETATTFELGARVNRGNVTLDATVFYTKSKDYIAAISTGTANVSQYQNVDRVKSWGMELGAEFDPGLWGGARPYVNLSNVTREFSYASGVTTRDSGTPEWSGIVGLRSDWAAGTLDGTWDVFVRAESNTVERDDTGAIVDETGGWGTLNLRGSVNLTSDVALTFELGNLTDKSYQAVDQIEAAGRNVSVFLTATF